MPDDPAFADLMIRVRRGEAQAAEQLFRQFQSQLRLEVRLRLRDPRLRQRIDEDDVCQSVLLSFFVRVRLGAYDVAAPGELVRLLAGMARNKVAAQARRHAAECRDFRRTEGLAGAKEVAAADASHSQVASGEELLREVRARLSAEEQIIANLRADGLSWAEVAQRLGGTADARRMQLQRAADRVVRELDLEHDNG
jgi:DNA-directed RNA polymerase specialized sigma24 family protein